MEMVCSYHQSLSTINLKLIRRDKIMFTFIICKYLKMDDCPPGKLAITLFAMIFDMLLILLLTENF